VFRSKRYLSTVREREKNDKKKIKGNEVCIFFQLMFLFFYYPIAATTQTTTNINDELKQIHAEFYVNINIIL